jgi:hypothetical protein
VLEKICWQIRSGEHLGSSLEARRSQRYILAGDPVKAKGHDVILEELGVLEGLGI